MKIGILCYIIGIEFDLFVHRQIRWSSIGSSIAMNSLLNSMEIDSHESESSAGITPLHAKEI